jgi:hypothetical protein
VRRQLKANLVSPTFTGTVSGIDKTMVIDNNFDAKQFFTATITSV